MKMKNFWTKWNTIKHVRHLKDKWGGAWEAQLVKCLPLAPVMILESWDPVPHPAPCSVGSLLLPLPYPDHLPLMISLSFSLSQINNIFLKNTTNCYFFVSLDFFFSHIRLNLWKNLIILAYVLAWLYFLQLSPYSDLNIFPNFHHENFHILRKYWKCSTMNTTSTTWIQQLTFCQVGFMELFI